jgi:hypothetical protein
MVCALVYAGVDSQELNDLYLLLEGGGRLEEFVDYYLQC